MSEKQITIDYKNLCENYSKVVGCYNTFDGSCIKEQCFTYRLLQLLKAKEQECEKLINKNNRLEEELNATKLLLEGKNNQYAAKMKVCDELHSIIQNRNEEIKNLNYVLYEERELTLDLGKANLKIASLERDISFHKNRFKYEIDKLKKELSSLLAEKNAIEIGRYEYKQECEELKREFQAQRDFTAHEQKLIYCVAYDETCKTGNDCKQEKCIFKDNIKLKQALAEIKEIAENSCCLQPTSTCEEYKNCNECSRTSDDVTVQQILQKISECEVEDEQL